LQVCKKTRIGEGGGATCCWGRCAGTIFGDLRDRVAAAIGSGTSARAAAGRLGGEREHGDWLGAAVASGGSRPSPPDGRRSPLALSRKLQTDQQAWIGEWVMGECASTIKERTSIPLRRRHFVALATSAQSPISSHGSARATEAQARPGDLRWTPLVRQAEPLLKVEPCRFRNRLRSAGARVGLI
jgi:hypothetical protein